MNHRALNNRKPRPHRLDDTADSTPAEDQPVPICSSNKAATATDLPETIPNRNSKKRPLSGFDVFVDDFIGMGQGTKKRLTNLRRSLLHTLDEVFRPLEPDESLSGRRMLGYLQDNPGLDHRYDEDDNRIATHRIECSSVILASIPRSQKRVSVLKWQSVLGELRSMSIAIPGSRGLFSLLQEVLRYHEPNSRIRLSRGVHDCLDDFRWLADDLASRLTRL